MIPLYSILHMLVDGVCAFAMFGTVLPQENGYLYMLLYNFCAFALQMPFGAVLDMICARDKAQRYNVPFLTAAAGIFCTIVGALTNPVLLGIGNALFHIGGGVGTIHEDTAKGYCGKGLGVFVAPGALGLYLGTWIAKNSSSKSCFFAVSVLMVLICMKMAVLPKVQSDKSVTAVPAKPFEKLYMAAGCFVVVVLRSYLGMTVTFGWKTTALAGFLAVLALVCGKVAGGFAAARFGAVKTIVASLLMAAVCYGVSEQFLAGIAALFLFNMTMPITLYLMISKFAQMPGFSFGFLTFALFLGFLPSYFELPLPADGTIIGIAGSMLSFIILLVCICAGGRNGGISD